MRKRAGSAARGRSNGFPGITSSLRSSRRTEETKRMKKIFPLSCLLVGLWLVARPGGAQDAAAERGKAYELYDQKRFAEAADAFQGYLQKNPDDAQAAVDFAALLSQLNRHTEAATLLEALHLKNPRHEAAYFKLGVEYVTLKRPADAEQVFAVLEKSAKDRKSVV